MKLRMSPIPILTGSVLGLGIMIFDLSFKTSLILIAALALPVGVISALIQRKIDGKWHE